MKTDYQNKQMTSKDEKMKDTTPEIDVEVQHVDDLAHEIEVPEENDFMIDGMPKPEAGEDPWFSFPQEGFSTQAKDMEDAIKKLESFKNSKK